MPVDHLLVKQRLSLIAEYISELNELATLSKDDFTKKRNAASAESFLRRSLEVVFDIGRHILAKNGGANMAIEYKGIAVGLQEKGIVTPELGKQLLKMAGYRNRMVHLYHQITDDELYEIVKQNLNDLTDFINSIKIFLSK
jgi:uncharacterized protein YutE (UPF0331/DUF86 family)